VSRRLGNHARIHSEKKVNEEDAGREHRRSSLWTTSWSSTTCIWSADRSQCIGEKQFHGWARTTASHGELPFAQRVSALAGALFSRSRVVITGVSNMHLVG
jgi:hypothetical protein